MARKTKVPKRLAGVKIPKTLRRGLKDLARSQSGKAVLADALAAAGAALAALESRKGSRTRAPLADKAPRVKAKEVAAEARSWTGAGAFEDAARAFADTLKRAAPTEPAPTAETPAPAAQH